MTFQELKRLSKKDLSGASTLRLAMVGDTATQLLAMAVKGYAHLEGFDLVLHEADYNQLDAQLYDRDSSLYSFAPDYILIFMAAQVLHESFCAMEANLRMDFADSVHAKMRSYWDHAKQNRPCTILQFNFVETNDMVFGNFGAKFERSFIFQLRKLNYLLSQSALTRQDLYLIDLSSVHNQIGAGRFYDEKLFLSARMPIAIEALPYVAKETAAVIKALNGYSKKCIVLDLDNTLWGGVIGDDGMVGIELGDLGRGQAYGDFQRWLRQLRERGVILAVCSKNDDAIAKEPFESHPDMVLRLEDISLFVANWENKADNIRFIQSTLNIGLDSMVFIDDNPFERNLVRSQISGIEVPELPEDPALYLPFLQSKNYFEAASISHEDSERTALYQAEIKRTGLRAQFDTIDEYLASLGMSAEAKPFCEFQYPRIAQLTQRSNQFNLRTIRYTEAEIAAIAVSPDHLGYYFTLSDIYGDHGLVSAVILRKLDPSAFFVDTWVMSCRVLKRGMEEFIVNKIAQLALGQNAGKLIGEYVRTKKNDMVSGLYPLLGFENHSGSSFALDLSTFKPRANYIKEI